MAITKVVSATQTSGTSLSLTCSGNRPFLFVHVNTAQSSITYNGVPLAKAIVSGSSEVWYLFNPSIGTYNITFASNTRAEAACFSNVSLSAGIINTGTSAVGGTNAAVVEITSLLATDCLIGGCTGSYGYISGLYGTVFGGGSGYSDSAYNIAGDDRAKIGWNGEDTKRLAALVVRNDDSIPSTGVAVVSLSDYGII